MTAEEINNKSGKPDAKETTRLKSLKCFYAAILFVPFLCSFCFKDIQLTQLLWAIHEAGHLTLGFDTSLSTIRTIMQIARQRIVICI